MTERRSRRRRGRHKGPPIPPPPPGHEVGAEVEVVIDAIAPKGDGIGPLGDKRAYAARTIPGERVRVKIRRHRREWIAVDLLEVVEPSPDRVEPRCPLFEQCSGCQLQHVAYPRQLALKQALVATQLRDHGGFLDAPVAPTLGADDPWHYRNHGRFTVSDGHLGFVRHFRREFLPVPQCPIMERRINAVMAHVDGRLRGATQCNIRVGGPEGALMLQPRLPQLDDDPPSGQPHLEEELLGHRFRVSAAAFFQVNRAQAERLVTLVCDRVHSGTPLAARSGSSPGGAEGPSGTVIDAYGGVGTFAVLLSPHVAKVISIEESGPAVQDARLNIEGLPNVELVLGKTEEVLAGIPGPVDAIVLDPPRSGCQPEALAAVIAHAPRRIVYVSCEPETLARDLRILVDAGYELLEVQPVDMFPHTHHIECVATLRQAAGAAA